MNIILFIIIGLIIVSLIFLLLMVLLSLCDLTIIQDIYNKYINKPIKQFKIRKHKILFLPSDSYFFDTLCLSAYEDYIISIQTIDGKWYYKGLLYFDYYNKFIIRCCDENNNVFYTYDSIYTNNIAYISFNSDKVYKRSKDAFKYNM